VVRAGNTTTKTADRPFEKILKAKRNSPMNCADREAEKKMILEIKRAAKKGDTLGGAFQVRAKGVPPGLGSHVSYIRKLDGRIARAFMSLQSVKAVEIGIGTQAGSAWGSEMQDEIFYDKKRGFFRKTNHAGGLEGGITNGEEVVVTVTMKPIATLKRSLASINLKTLRPEKASFERSDVCAVPAGSVIGEAILAFELADALLEKTGGDSIAEVKRNFQGYLKQVAGFRLR
jgi:chorismate synthase